MIRYFLTLILFAGVLTAAAQTMNDGELSPADAKQETALKAQEAAIAQQLQALQKKRADAKLHHHVRGLAVASKADDAVHANGVDVTVTYTPQSDLTKVLYPYELPAKIQWLWDMNAQGKPASVDELPWNKGQTLTKNFAIGEHYATVIVIDGRGRMIEQDHIKIRVNHPIEVE